jgi:hypothetical protein
MSAFWFTSEGCRAPGSWDKCSVGQLSCNSMYCVMGVFILNTGAAIQMVFVTSHCVFHCGGGGVLSPWGGGGEGDTLCDMLSLYFPLQWV